MRYITKDEFINSHISQSDLMQLTDGTGEINDVVLEAANEECSLEMEGYLRGIYTVALNAEDAKQLKGVLGDLMVCKLYKRRGLVSEYASILYKDTIQKLKDIRMGKFCLAITQEDTESRKVQTKTSVLYLENKKKFNFS